jgi:hypothetical protein
MDCDMAQWVDHPTAPIKGSESLRTNGVWENTGLMSFDKYQPLIDAYFAAKNAPPPVPPPPTVAEQLAMLDAANVLTQRNLRETVMLMAEAFKQVSSGTVDLSNIPGVAKVYEVEAQAEALRALL